MVEARWTVPERINFHNLLMKSELFYGEKYINLTWNQTDGENEKNKVFHDEYWIFHGYLRIKKMKKASIMDTEFNSKICKNCPTGSYFRLVLLKATQLCHRNSTYCFSNCMRCSQWKPILNLRKFRARKISPTFTTRLKTQVYDTILWNGTMNRGTRIFVICDKFDARSRWRMCWTSVEI